MRRVLVFALTFLCACDEAPTVEDEMRTKLIHQTNLAVMKSRRYLMFIEYDYLQHLENSHVEPRHHMDIQTTLGRGAGEDSSSSEVAGL